MSPNTARDSEGYKCGIWSATDTSRCLKSNKMSDNLVKIKELVLCGHCKRVFNDTNLLPKDLACKHSFCLECIQSGLSKMNNTKGSGVRSGELYCDLCWKLTELNEKGPQALETNSSILALVELYMKLQGDNPNMTNGGDVSDKNILPDQTVDYIEPCLVHNAPLGLWCINCELPLCSICQKTLHSDPGHHTIWNFHHAKEQMVKQVQAELRRMSQVEENVRQLARRQRQFLILIRDACTALMREIQSSLDGDWNVDPTVGIRETLTQLQFGLLEAKSPKDVHDLYPVLIPKKHELQAKCHEMIIQCQLNDLIGHSEVIFDFESLQSAVRSILSNEKEIKPIPLQQTLQDPILFLTNYCMSQLFSRSHQRANEEGFLLNPNQRRQMVNSPPDILANPTPPTIPTPPQNFPVSEPSELFPNPHEITLPLVEYPTPQLQPVQSSLPATPAEQPSVTSRPPTPPAPSPPQAPRVAPQATTAQIVQMQNSVPVEPPAPIIHPPVRPVPTRSPANVSPRYFFNIDINGSFKGRIVIETRPDVAPKMCRNFDRLTTADRRTSYKGCNFFQCWKNESVITGDYECNTGRGGKSIYDDGFFQPDETRLPAIRGAVGMRRQQKKHDQNCLVGSQFRIILQEQMFTGIFGHVIEGVELVEMIASFGDMTGKPTKTITIAKCGKL